MHQSSVAALLLRHFEWNKEKLIEKFMDNAMAVNTAAGIVVPEKSSEQGRSSSRVHSPQIPSQAPRRTSRRTTTEAPKSGKARILERISPPAEDHFVCPICFDDTQTNTYELTCGHKFCTSCWHMYIVSKIKTEAECCITCMQEDCALVASDDFVKKALSTDNKTYHRYLELQARHFVSCNHSLKYCPYPACSYTVSCPSASSKSSLTTMVPIVTCRDSHTFCFGCNVDADHRPVVCGVAKMWL